MVVLKKYNILEKNKNYEYNIKLVQFLSLKIN